MTSEEFLKESTIAISSGEKDLEELLDFAQQMLSKTTIGKHTKAKTIISFNTFSAMYQRADGALALVKNKQGNVASVIIRSMWETLVTYDFIYLQRGNRNIEILFGLESVQVLKSLKHIKQLRQEHPQSDTWQAIMPDPDLNRMITQKQVEIDRYNTKYPFDRLTRHDTLLKRLKDIDDHSITKDPARKSLMQFNYRTTYWLLSGDTHSTILGNSDNSRIYKSSHIEVRLESGNMDTLRAVHLAFKLLHSFLRSFNRTFRLGLGDEIRRFSMIDRRHNVQYSNIESKL